MKKTISIVLSLLLVLSSSGMAYAQHFCGGMEMLSKITVGEKHLSCGMKMELPGCADEASLDMEAHCCENQFTQIETDDNFAKAAFNIEFQKTWAAAFVQIFVFQQFEYNSSKPNLYKDYNPPPLDKDILVLYQVFLI